jgi:hypothetical protein
MAYSTARATESAGMAIFLYRSFTNSAEDGSEVPFFSSDSTAPGEMIVHRMFSECSSIRNPSVKARTADFVAQLTVPPGANTLIRKNRGEVDDVTALLLLHLGQDGGNSVQNTLVVDVNLPIPFLHLKKTDRQEDGSARWA